MRYGLMLRAGIGVALAITPISIAILQAAADAQGSASAISEKDRREGAQAHPELLKEFGGAYSGSQVPYVTAVGKRIAVQSGLANSESAYTITLLNSPVMNAFAIPGGYVYVTRQLMGLMNDEAELASVLGHEVGHVAARHSQKRSTRSTLGQLLSVGLGVLTGSSELMQIAGKASQLYTLSYSRSQEYQADDLGIRYLARAGYDPYAAADMLASLERSTTLDSQIAGRDGDKETPSWARSHPLTADRVERARRQAAASGVKQGQGVRNRDAFLNALDGTLYGDDPAQGVVDGRWFRHPGLKLQFQAPQGFAIDNGTDMVTIQGNGGQAQFAGGTLGTDGLSGYVDRVFRSLGGGNNQISHGTPQRGSIGGMEILSATARANSNSGAVDVTVTAYRWAANRAFHFVTIVPAGRGIGPFAGMIDSLRRMSDSEAKAIRPRIIDVVTVKPGDTMESLAGRMAYDDLKMDRFLVLNALTAKAALRPGEKVKLVVYGSPH